MVLDHHKAEGPPPPIVATVNPNRLDCTSGLSSLCAAAVAFLAAVATVRALRRQGFFNARKEPDLIGLLDLVALATVCDVMPLTGVNRALVCQGLKVMARRARPGVAALLDVALVARPADRRHLRLRARPAHQRRGADRRGRSRPAPAAVRGPGRGRVARRHARCGEPPAPGGRGGDAGRCAACRRGAGGAGARDAGGQRSGLASGRGRHRRRPDQGALQPPGLRRRHRGRAGQGIGPFGGRAGPGRGGDRRAPGGHSEDRRRPSDGGGVLAARRRGWRSSTPSSTNAWPLRRCCRARPICRWRARWRCRARRRNWRSQLARLAPFGAGNEEPMLVLQRARVVRADRVGREGTAIRAFVEGEGGGPRLKAMLFRARDGALARHCLRATVCRCISPAICAPRNGTVRSVLASSSPTWRRLDPAPEPSATHRCPRADPALRCPVRLEAQDTSLSRW